jgi:hypothetical protein
MAAQAKRSLTYFDGCGSVTELSGFGSPVDARQTVFTPIPVVRGLVTASLQRWFDDFS